MIVTNESAFGLGPSARKVGLPNGPARAERSETERGRNALESATSQRLTLGLSWAFTHERSVARGGIVFRPDGSNDAPPRVLGVAMAIGAELTRRGIAPVFRGLEWYCSQKRDRPWWADLESDVLALMLDAQWIACRYPKHATAWERAAGMLRNDGTEPTARFLLKDGKREPAQLVRALGLSQDQQFELAFAHTIHVERIKASVWQRQPTAFQRIEQSVHELDRRSDLAGVETTIRRRKGVWLAAQLANNKPTRTSDLYAMQPGGEKLPRNLAAKIIGKLPRTTLAACGSSKAFSATDDCPAEL